MRKRIPPKDLTTTAIHLSKLPMKKCPSRTSRKRFKNLRSPTAYKSTNYQVTNRFFFLIMGIAIRYNRVCPTLNLFLEDCLCNWPAAAAWFVEDPGGPAEEDEGLEEDENVELFLSW